MIPVHTPSAVGGGFEFRSGQTKGINCGNDFHWSGKSCDLLQLLTSDLNSNGIWLDLPCSGQANRILIKFMKASQQLNIL